MVTFLEEVKKKNVKYKVQSNLVERSLQLEELSNSSACLY